MGMVVDSYRFAAAAPAFEPTDITGCILWLDAADETTIALVGAGPETNTWTSKSSNGGVWARLNIGYGPSSGTRTLNSLNVLDFKGLGLNNNGNMRANDNWNTFVSAPQSVTLFIVADHDNTDVLGLFDGAPLTANPLRAKSGAWEIWNNNPAVSISATVGAQIWTVKANNSRSLSVSKNAGTPSTGSGSATNITWTQASIGGNNGGAELDAGIGEVLVYNSVLSAGDTADVEGYLADKWGITI